MKAPPEGQAEMEQGSPFGKASLIARRLVEHGVRFVEVTLDGWDTHADNFNAVTGLSKQLDAGLAGLVSDLAARGLLGQTLVVCLGEFGRTPEINPQQGRDHWSEVFSAVLAGGGVRGGQVMAPATPGARLQGPARDGPRPVRHAFVRVRRQRHQAVPNAGGPAHPPGRKRQGGRRTLRLSKVVAGCSMGTFTEGAQVTGHRALDGPTHPSVGTFRPGNAP